MDKFPKLGLLLACLSINILTVYTQDVCVKKNSCSCEFSNGTGIDISPTAISTFYTAQFYQEKNNGTASQFEMSLYYFHPCSDAVVPNINSTKIGDTCADPLSICRHRTTMNSKADPKGALFEVTESAYNYMGSSNKTEFSADGRSIIFENGPSSTIVLLVCAQIANKLEVYDVEDPKKIVLSFYSQDACLKQIEELGRSFGSTLVIIFFSLVIFYLVLGVLTKKFLMGATGLEVVPNLAFWSDLPNLVKDGWAFTANGFKLPARGPGPVTSPDPNSYDSI